MPTEAPPPPLSLTDCSKPVTPFAVTPAVRDAVQGVLPASGTKEAQEKTIKQALAESFKLIIAHVNANFVGLTNQALKNYQDNDTPSPENDALWEKLRDDVRRIFQGAQSSCEIQLSTTTLKGFNFCEQSEEVILNDEEGSPRSSIDIKFGIGDFIGSVSLEILYGSTVIVDLCLPNGCGNLIHQTPCEDIIIKKEDISAYQSWFLCTQAPDKIRPDEWAIQY